MCVCVCVCVVVWVSDEIDSESGKRMQKIFTDQLGR